MKTKLNEEIKNNNLLREPEKYNDDFEIKESNIKGAGDGLFLTKDKNKCKILQ